MQFAVGHVLDTTLVADVTDDERVMVENELLVIVILGVVLTEGFLFQVKV